MKRHTKRKSKLKGFKRFYVFYLCIIAVALLSVFLSVDRLMVRYEQSVPENVVLNMLNTAGKSDGSLGEYLQEHCFADNLPGGKARSKAFYDKVAFSDKLEVKKDLLNSDEEVFVYSVVADDEPLISVALQKEKSENALGGLLKISNFSLKYAYLRNEDSAKKSINYGSDGTVSFTILVPEGFSVYFDGGLVDLSGSKTDVIDDFQSVNSYGIVPKAKRIDFNLSYEPKIVITNNADEEVKVDLIGSTYYAYADFAQSDEAKSIILKNFEPIKMNELWAEFMIDNVSGASHGLSNVLSQGHILTGSSLYNQAISWANGIEITWVSDFSKEWFTDETIGNYVLYNNDFCSCDVSFTHHIFVTFGGTYGDQPVEYSTRMFFIRTDGEWYWAGSLNMIGR